MLIPHQPEVVAADVEDHAIAGQETRRRKVGLDLRRRLPVRLLGLLHPALERRRGIRMPRHVLPNVPLADDLHARTFFRCK